MVSIGQGLCQKRILVTRAKEQAKTFSEKIEQHDGIPIEVPLISIEESRNQTEIYTELSNLDQYQWIIFTSVNGVKHFFRFLEKHNLIMNDKSRPQIAVVGKKTYKALEDFGYQADVIPTNFVAEGLFEAIQKHATANERVLLARGNLGRTFLPKQLKTMGIEVTDLVIYETIMDKSQQRELNKLLLEGSIDIITFTSSSTVKHFFEMVDQENWRSAVNHVTFACIGPIAAKTADEYGLEIKIIPEEYTIDGLVKAMISYINKGDNQ